MPMAHFGFMQSADRLSAAEEEGSFTITSWPLLAPHLPHFVSSNLISQRAGLRIITRFRRLPKFPPPFFNLRRLSKRVCCAPAARAFSASEFLSRHSLERRRPGADPSYRRTEAVCTHLCVQGQLCRTRPSKRSLDRLHADPERRSERAEGRCDFWFLLRVTVDSLPSPGAPVTTSVFITLSCSP